MRKIEAVIGPFTVDDVKDALSALGGGGLTVTEVRGSSNEADRTEHHLDAEYTTDLVPKAAVEVVVVADVVAAVVATICRAARTELAGEGYVFVLPVGAAIRIRTGEAGEAVLC
jgi:nitrogen regulatory protein P-II 1